MLQEDSNQYMQSNERVWQWLHDIPDFRPQEDVSISKNWVSFSSSASFTPHLEGWEKESLCEALQPKNPFSKLFCCFRGILKQSARTHMKAVDSLDERRNSFEEESMLDISQEHERWFLTHIERD